MIGRALAVSAVFAAVVSASAQAPAPAPAPRSRFAELYSAYEAGRTDDVALSLQSGWDFEQIRVDYFNALSRWRTAWDPRHATFGLEVAIRAYELRWTDPWRLLVAARDLVTARPDAPGVNARDDRFELTFHKAAIAYLAGVPMPNEVAAYLAPLAERVNIGVKTRKAPGLTDPRLILGAAMAEETRTLPAGLGATGALRSWVIAPGNGALRVQLQGIVDLLGLVTSARDTATEAATRRAFLLHRLGAHGRALEAIDAIPASADPVVGYWQALVRGRILAATGRPEDAIREYERAVQLQPEAQTPAVALSVLLLTLNQRDRAIIWAARARTTAGTSDPWPQYWLGDRRHLAGWIADLRQARP